jgi:hypothetical protein
MPNLFPRFQTPQSGGILFVNQPGADSFRALRVDVGDQHLYWQPTYQNILRVEGAFGEFFPQAEFFENGNRVLFTKHIEGVEVLCKTRALRSGERIPRREWVRFLATWQSFKLLADRNGIPDDFRNFIIKFGPPSVERYPAAYRLYRPHWYSRPRLFILWGLEPVGGADFISLSPEQAISEVDARVETDREEASSQVFLWLKALACFLLACVLLLFVVWLCLPRPVVDFELTAQAMQSTQPINKTGFDQEWVWGQTAYQWTFDQGQPASSPDFQPDVLWTQPGLHDTTLKVTQSTLWGFLYKIEAKSKSVLVKEAPKPPPVIVVIPPGGHGFGSVDKPKDDKNPGGPGGPGIPSDPKMDSEGKPLTGGSELKPATEDTMKPAESKQGDDGKAMPLDSTEKSKDKPGLEALPGGEDKPGSMKGEKTPEDRPANLGENGPKQENTTSSGPSEIKPAPDNQKRSLNAPKVFIDGIPVIIDVSGSQEMKFLVTSDPDIIIEQVLIDKDSIDLASKGRFTRRLASGSHTIRVKYRSANSDIHESIAIPLKVSAVMMPDNAVGPSTKETTESDKTKINPSSKPNTEPVPAPQPQTSDKNDKKLA